MPTSGSNGCWSSAKPFAFTDKSDIVLSCLLLVITGIFTEVRSQEPHSFVCLLDSQQTHMFKCSLQLQVVSFQGKGTRWGGGQIRGAAWHACTTAAAGAGAPALECCWPASWLQPLAAVWRENRR